MLIRLNITTPTMKEIPPARRWLTPLGWVPCRRLWHEKVTMCFVSNPFFLTTDHDLQKAHAWEEQNLSRIADLSYLRSSLVPCLSLGEDMTLMQVEIHSDFFLFFLHWHDDDACLSIFLTRFFLWWLFFLIHSIQFFPTTSRYMNDGLPQQTHSLLTLLGLEIAYVTSQGRLTGVVGLEEV